MTRKFFVPLLEYLNKIKLTILVGATRILCKKSCRKGAGDSVFLISAMIFLSTEVGDDSSHVQASAQGVADLADQ